MIALAEVLLDLNSILFNTFFFHNFFYIRTSRLKKTQYLWTCWKHAEAGDTLRTYFTYCAQRRWLLGPLGTKLRFRLRSNFFTRARIKAPSWGFGSVLFIYSGRAAPSWGFGSVLFIYSGRTAPSWGFGSVLFILLLLLYCSAPSLGFGSVLIFYSSR